MQCFLFLFFINNVKCGAKFFISWQIPIFPQALLRGSFTFSDKVLIDRVNNIRFHPKMFKKGYPISIPYQGHKEVPFPMSQSREPLTSNGSCAG